MDSELWGRVKPGTAVIVANEYDGVFKASVSEIDIKIEVYRPTLRIGYPYGKTRESGTVRIKYNSEEIIENLANLIEYNQGVFLALRSKYTEWQRKLRVSDEKKDEFLYLTTAFK